MEHSFLYIFLRPSGAEVTRMLDQRMTDHLTAVTVNYSQSVIFSWPKVNDRAPLPSPRMTQGKKSKKRGVRTFLFFLVIIKLLRYQEVADSC